MFQKQQALGLRAADQPGFRHIRYRVSLVSTFAAADLRA